MKKLLVVVVVVFAPLMVYSQNDLQKAMEYPVIKGHKYAGVIPISNVDEVPDPTIEYKIVINATGHSKDSSKFNCVIYNIGRYFNLHVAAGIPKENIEIVVAVHAWAFDSFLKNEAYRSEFEIDNPNLAIISELKKKAFGSLFVARLLPIVDIQKNCSFQRLFLPLRPKPHLLRIK